MIKQRCQTCVGSGKVMGGGMMFKDCEDCDGVGKIYIDDSVMKKDSEQYNSAKQKIKELSSDISEAQAEKLLDEELEKQSNVKRLRKKGRES